MNFTEKMNSLASENRPFLFIINADMSESHVIPLEDAANEQIFYSIQNYSNSNKLPLTHSRDTCSIHTKKALPYTEYRAIFDRLHREFCAGNTFLANLTVETEINMNGSLEDIFYLSKSPYKLLFKNNFVLFSPETFVKTDGTYIYTYPMKGTIRADMENAEQILLADEKEFAEHITVVDLLRNDLGMVSSHVEVTRFRYIEPVFIPKHPLLQTVTEIRGKIRQEFIDKPGNLIETLLPAGSVTGAPKKKTVSILHELEPHNRGYYTGVFGIWQNGVINSSVMIRFIEKRGNSFYYKSGGGITVYSDSKSEYAEILHKIYVPVY